MHRTPLRIWLALAVAALLVVAGCAKDEAVTTAATTTPVTAQSGSGTEPVEPADDGHDPGGGEDEGSDVDEACSVIGEIDDVEDPDVDEAIELMEQARDAAPADLTDHWDVLIDAMEDIAAAQGDSDAEDEVLTALLDDPDFLDAAAAIDDFAEEECGLDIDLDPNDSPDSSTEDETPVGDDEVGADPDDPLTLDAVQTHLADEHGSEEWWPVFEEASWRLRIGVDPTWTITLEASSDWDTLSTDDLVAACDAIATYADAAEPDEEQDIAVEVLDPDDDVLVSRLFRDEACTESG